MGSQQPPLAALQAELLELLTRYAEAQALAAVTTSDARRHRVNADCLAIQRRIVDLEDLISRTPARNLEDAALQLRRLQVHVGERDVRGRLLSSALAAVESAAR